tara:strand:- start:2073 stop:2387 length:315 start_codon:yes stop_codon:yes gene_type:complete
MLHKEMKRVLAEFETLGLLNKKMKFKCFDEGMATYHIKEKSGGFHEISIINDDITFFRNEKLTGLLQKTPFFFNHRYFYKLDPMSKEGFHCENVFMFKIGDYEN